ncbi:MAG: universal stress protein [Solirubrobacteraceae bacterium]|nr:universal stress protein [Solirubrobacteraceae bacterium]
MFQTIIVGIEGRRSQDDEALALATRLGEPGAEIIATNVAIGHATVLGRSGALDEGEAIVDAFTEPRVRTEGSVVQAESVGRGLRDVALGARADLIVIASSRRGALGELFAGDAVRDVLHHAPCPVAVATVGSGESGALRRIVIGYDGSGESEAALVEAVRIARRDDADVSVVDVVEPMVQAAANPGAWLGGSIDEQYAIAREQLDGLVERFGIRGVIAVGRAATELTDASRGADLLAIGFREHGLLDRLLVGSTVNQLLHAQSASMLITPPDSGRPTVADALDNIPTRAPAAAGGTA